MPHGIFNRLSGVVGSVTIPMLGAHVGTMEQWELSRRGEEDDPKHGTYDFRCVFSYLNELLFTDPDYKDEREVVVEMGRGRQRLQFRVDMADDEETVLRGRTLLMKGVKIHNASEDAQSA